MDAILDLCQETGLNTAGTAKDYSISFTLDPNKWDAFRISKDFEGDWEYVKYLNSKHVESAAYKSVTDKHGGVFIWVIQPSKIPIPSFRYVAYIGMSDGNLKKSIINFKKNVSKCSGRLSEMLFEEYSPNLYLAYYKCDDRAYTKELLRELVNAVQPPIQEIPIYLDDLDEMEAF